MKQCSDCKQFKDAKSFYVRTKGKNTLSYSCKKCSLLACHNWYKVNKEKHKKQTKLWYDGNFLLVKNKALIAKYGITLQQFNEYQVKQNNLCALCNKPEIRKDSKSGKLVVLSVDHNHETGRVRGLVCKHCNLYIIRDHTLASARALVAYLEKYEKSLDIPPIPGVEFNIIKGRQRALIAMGAKPFYEINQYPLLCPDTLTGRM